jgi:hypothetical protein
MAKAGIIVAFAHAWTLEWKRQSSVPSALQA